MIVFAAMVVALAIGSALWLPLPCLCRLLAWLVAFLFSAPICLLVGINTFSATTRT